ncbi:MAG: hypothetical protein ABS43_13410 [Bordetella sp. SCN 67-23]|nr:hypothetical protein [Burkholderiales bacterium]ODS73568.1 MAG: hypothetical protein ABS43_13410 [Bordetella sp. SCN 67-23]OJW89436.1 MAG: hypothetical protein BGO71_19420 [Burkholderiales bacterium 67-32]
MHLSKAVLLSLGELDGAIVSPYVIGLILWRLYRGREFRGESLGLGKVHPEKKDVTRAIDQLAKAGVLDAVGAVVSPRMYALLGRTALQPAEIVCSADPFCYVSHLSAMEHHGLTDRLPAVLHITRPAPRAWSQFARERMRGDYGEDYEMALKAGMPSLARPVFAKKIGGRTVIEFNSLHLGAFRTVRGSPLRVATLGRTYLDMLEQPGLCGGMWHVLTVFRSHASANLATIVDEVERHGKAIDKVRAGYILEEFCGLAHPIFREWVRLAARGGSRRLDPKEEYRPNYSARWCLSLNVDFLDDPDA